MRAHLIHGIHSEGGGATRLLAPYFEAEGFEPVVYDYGWATGIFSRWTNPRRARTIARQVRSEDILVAHSNGGTLACMVEELVPLTGLVLIRPARDEDVEFRHARFVDVYHNEGDVVIEASEALGFFDLLPHRYGRLGRIGYRGRSRNVCSIDDGNLTVDLARIGTRLPPLCGHSEMFEPGKLEHWGPYYAKRARQRHFAALADDA